MSARREFADRIFEKVVLGSIIAIIISMLKFYGDSFVSYYNELSEQQQYIDNRIIRHQRTIYDGISEYLSLPYEIIEGSKKSSDLSGKSFDKVSKALVHAKLDLKIGIIEPKIRENMISQIDCVNDQIASISAINDPKMAEVKEIEKKTISCLRIMDGIFDKIIKQRYKKKNYTIFQYLTEFEQFALMMIIGLSFFVLTFAVYFSVRHGHLMPRSGFQGKAQPASDPDKVEKEPQPKRPGK